MPADLKKLAKPIKMVAFDVDGVLTDGRLFLGEDGNEYKAFHVRDGQGLVLLCDAKIEVAIITSRESKLVAKRMSSLGIRHIYQNQKNKADTMRQIMKRSNLSKQEIAYLGDDIVDIPAMALVGFKIAVNDAHPTVIQYADWVTTANGGYGAARELTDFILKHQNLLPPSYDCLHPQKN